MVEGNETRIEPGMVLRTTGDLSAQKVWRTDEDDCLMTDEVSKLLLTRPAKLESQRFSGKTHDSSSDCLIESVLAGRIRSRHPTDHRRTPRRVPTRRRLGG